MTIAHDIFFFIVLIGVLITVHEYGHYWVAKRCGVKVLTFSIGFGPALRAWMVGETRWQVAALPFGGYVKMLDEREGPVEADELHRAFNRQSVGKRMLVVVAGPLANLVTAILLYWLIFLGGVDVEMPTIGSVVPASMADKAGFRVGDTIVQMGARHIDGWSDILLATIDEASARNHVDVVLRHANGQVAHTELDLSTIDKAQVDPNLPGRLGIFPTSTRIVFGDPTPKGAAAAAGLQKDDELLKLDGRDVVSTDAFVSDIQARAGVLTHMLVKRGARSVDVSLTPQLSRGDDGRAIGKIGIAVGDVLDDAQLRALHRHIDLSPVAALHRAMSETYDESAFTLKMLWRLVTGHVSVKQLSGPVGIAKLAGRSAELGWRAFVQSMCLVSISLGVLNLLPIPVLDGGHLLYYSAELLRGRPLSERAMELGLRLGVGLLVALMVVALYNDIARNLGGG